MHYEVFCATCNIIFLTVWKGIIYVEFISVVSYTEKLQYWDGSHKWFILVLVFMDDSNTNSVFQMGFKAYFQLEKFLNQEE